MLTDAELDRNVLACESQARGVGDGAPAYIAIHAFRALIAQAREANRLREELERLRCDLADQRLIVRGVAYCAEVVRTPALRDIREPEDSIEWRTPGFFLCWLAPLLQVHIGADPDGKYRLKPDDRAALKERT